MYLLYMGVYIYIVYVYIYIYCICIYIVYVYILYMYIYIVYVYILYMYALCILSFLMHPYIHSLCSVCLGVRYRFHGIFLYTDIGIYTYLLICLSLPIYRYMDIYISSYLSVSLSLVSKFMSSGRQTEIFADAPAPFLLVAHLQTDAFTRLPGDRHDNKVVLCISCLLLQRGRG